MELNKKFIVFLKKRKVWLKVCVRITLLFFLYYINLLGDFFFMWCKIFSLVLIGNKIEGF